MGYYRLLMCRSTIYWTKSRAKSIKWGVKSWETDEEGEGVTSLALWEWTVVLLIAFIHDRSQVRHWNETLPEPRQTYITYMCHFVSWKNSVAQRDRKHLRFYNLPAVARANSPWDTAGFESRRQALENNSSIHTGLHLTSPEGLRTVRGCSFSSSDLKRSETPT